MTLDEVSTYDTIFTARPRSALSFLDEFARDWVTARIFLAAVVKRSAITFLSIFNDTVATVSSDFKLDEKVSQIKFESFLKQT